jgi:hypothetical protein
MAQLVELALGPSTTRRTHRAPRRRLGARPVRRAAIDDAAQSPCTALRVLESGAFLAATLSTLASSTRASLSNGDLYGMDDAG